MVRTGSAQASGGVDIVVVDAAGKPVNYAIVRILGNSVRVGVTGPDGRARFTDVPPGSYIIVVTKASFNSARVGPLALEDGTQVVVTVGKPMQQIGQVATTTPSPPPTTITDTDPRRALADTPGQLLSYVPGIDLVPLSTGGVAAEQFGVPSQTGLRVENLHLGPPGTTVDLRGIPLGLFDGANSTNDTSGGDLGGTVRLGLPSPTISSLVSVNERVAALSDEVAASARGTAGSIGYALAAATDIARGDLDGAMFLDQSGSDYSHTAGTDSRGVALKLRIPFGLSNVLSTTSLLTDALSDDVCLVSANTPCSYGPGAQTRQGTSAFGAQDAAALGDFGLSTAFETSTLQYDLRRPAAAFLGVAQPEYANTSVRTQSANVALQAPSAGRHTLSLVYSLVTTSPSTTSNDPQLGLGVGNHRFGTLRLDDQYELAARDNLNASISSVQTDLARAAAASFTARRQFSRGSYLSLEYKANELGFPETLPAGFAAPPDVEYDCASRTAVVPAQGSTITAQPRLTEASATFVSRGPQIDFSASLFHRSLYDSPVSFAFNATGFADPAYLDLLTAAWASPLVCGFGVPQIVLQEQIIDRHVIYDGGTGTIRKHFGNRGQIIGNFSFMHAYSASPISATVYNPAILSGAQLPGVPIISGALIGEYDIRRHSSLFASLRFIGRNDATGRGGTTVASVGWSVDVARGSVSMSETNVFGGGGASFATFGAPLQAVANGPLFGTLRYPLAPRTLSLAYRTTIGPPASRASSQDSLAAEADSSGFQLQPFPSDPPVDALGLANDNPECGPERAAVAHRIFEAIALFSQTASKGDAPGPDGTSFAFRSTPRNTVLVSSSRRAVTAALFACGFIHGGDANDVASLQLYNPTPAEQRAYELLFTTRVGLYIVGQVATVERQVTLRSLTQPPIAGPFGVVASCPSDRLSAAKSLLAEMRASLATDPPSKTETFDVIRHSDTVRVWDELRLRDPTLFTVIATCADLADGSRSELEQLGIGGANPPALNYSGSIGLYLVH